MDDDGDHQNALVCQTCAFEVGGTQKSSMDMENYWHCHLWRLKEEITANKICVPGNREKGVQINDIIMSLLIPSIRE